MYKNILSNFLSFAILISSPTFANSAHAQQQNVDAAPKAHSTESTGNYDIDLGQIYGAISSARLRENICSRNFPELSSKLREVHLEWRNKNLSFIQDIEKRFQERLWVSVGDNKKEFLLLRKQLADDEMQYEEGLEEIMRGQGGDELKYECDNFDMFLASDVMDLESFFAEQLAVVRKGPPKNSK